MRIDAHQHFWQYSAQEYGWIGPEMDGLKQDRLPGDLAPGRYPIELGWYERGTGTRWPVPLPGRGQVDRLLLHTVVSTSSA